MSAPRVLVIGAVQGHLEKAFQKVTKLHAKQNFSFVIVVGDLFAGESSEESESQVRSLLDGSIKIPVPTYFTLGDHSIPESVQGKLETDGEVTGNLFYLGRKGTLKTTEGIRIVNLGGRLLQNEASVTQGVGKYDPLYTESEARSLHGAHSADILITNQWPINIQSNSQVHVPESIDVSSSTQSIANLCLALKPRYHFASSPSAMWTREPFMIPAAVQGRELKSYDDLDGPVRFTSLASIQAPNKECLSAFALDPTKPASTDGAQQTCPLSTSTPASKRKRDANDDQSHQSYNRYAQHSDSHHPPAGRGGKNNKRNKNYDPSSCFMCMSNEAQFDTSMLVSIAEESILTVLKGPLPVRGQTFPQLKSSGHIMIIPMYHAADEASHGQRTQVDLSREFAEMTAYRHSLQRFLGSKGLGAVCWELNRTGIRHFHWQLLACPVDPIKTGLVEAAYKIAAERYKTRSVDDTKGAEKETPVKFVSCAPDSLIQGQRSDFFRVWIWYPSDTTETTQSPSTQPPPSTTPPSNPIQAADALSNGQDNNTTKPTLPKIQGIEKSMFFPLPPSLRFDISFGREVMAGILQLEDRSDWRNLPSGNGLEEQDAKAFQEEFQRPLGEGREGWDFAMA